jgi:Flp pilus assembly protein CpaB
VRLSSGRPAAPSLRGLLSTRQGTLALALLSALIACVVIVVALSSYRHSANTTPQQETVLTATGLIHKGQSGSLIASGQLYKPLPTLANQVPANAVTDALFLQGKVAVSNILPGQQLTTADFAVATGVAAQLSPNERAVSVNLDAAHGLGGVLADGDHVDLYGAFTFQNTPIISLMVANALVLRAPGTTAPSNGNTAPSNGNTVLVVSDSQAPEVAYASDNGKLWLVLRPPNATNPAAGATTLNSILFGTHPSLKPTTSAVTGANGVTP